MTTTAILISFAPLVGRQSKAVINVLKQVNSSEIQSTGDSLKFVPAPILH